MAASHPKNPGDGRPGWENQRSSEEMYQGGFSTNQNQTGNVVIPQFSPFTMTNESHQLLFSILSRMIPQSSQQSTLNVGTMYGPLLGLFPLLASLGQRAQLELHLMQQRSLNTIAYTDRPSARPLPSQGQQYPRFHPPTNMNRYELFEECKGFRQQRYGKTYLAIYWMHFRDAGTSLASPLFENNVSGHAEEHLLKHLHVQMEYMDKSRVESVTIMQNASPCSTCSDRYRLRLEKLVKECDVKVVIVFSAFHWLRRLSYPNNDIPMHKHYHNQRALHNLWQAGVAVRTTCYEDWVRLCIALQVPRPVSLRSQEDYCRSRRGHEDCLLRQDLQAVLCYRV